MTTYHIHSLSSNGQRHAKIDGIDRNCAATRFCSLAERSFYVNGWHQLFPQTQGPRKMFEPWTQEAAGILCMSPTGKQTKERSCKIVFVHLSTNLIMVNAVQSSCRCCKPRVEVTIFWLSAYLASSRSLEPKKAKTTMEQLPQAEFHQKRSAALNRKIAWLTASKNIFTRKEKQDRLGSSFSMGHVRRPLAFQQRCDSTAPPLCRKTDGRVNALKVFLTRAASTHFFLV